MILADLSPRLRRERVAAALEIALRDLPGPEGTTWLVERVCVLLDTRERQAVARDLLSLAPDHPRASVGEPETVRQYGRDMLVRRWTWSPASAAPAAPPEAKSAAPLLVRCPHCNERDFPRNITEDGRCTACKWGV